MLFIVFSFNFKPKMKRAISEAYKRYRKRTKSDADDVVESMNQVPEKNRSINVESFGDMDNKSPLFISKRATRKRIPIDAELPYNEDSLSECKSIERHLTKQANGREYNAFTLPSNFKSLGSMTKLHILNNATATNFKDLLRTKETKPKCYLEFECSYCNKIVTSKAMLRRHFQEHFDCAKKIKATSRSFLGLPCPYCPIKLASRATLGRHLRGHFERSMCPFCDRRYKNRIDLQLHVAREHNAIECSPSFTCHICGKHFHRNENLTKHMRTHSNDRPFECDVCHKTFGRKDKLKLHLDWHYGIKPHQCPHCDRTFLQRTHMNNHVLTHSGLKPFKCTVCDKAYNLARSLKSHMNVHLVKHQ